VVQKEKVPGTKKRTDGALPLHHDAGARRITDHRDLIVRGTGKHDKIDQRQAEKLVPSIIIHTDVLECIYVVRIVLFAPIAPIVYVYAASRVNALLNTTNVDQLHLISRTIPSAPWTTLRCRVDLPSAPR
jgi:hypothetical protein